MIFDLGKAEDDFLRLLDDPIKGFLPINYSYSIYNLQMTRSKDNLCEQISHMLLEIVLVFSEEVLLSYICYGVLH